MPVSWSGIASTWARPGKDNKNTSCTPQTPTINGKTNWIYKIDGTNVVTESPIIDPIGNVIVAYKDEQRSIFPDGRIVAVKVSDGSYFWQSPWGYNGQIVVTSNGDFFISGCMYFYSWSHFQSLQYGGTFDGTVNMTYPLAGAPCDHNGDIYVARSDQGGGV
jgi:hypothetical protein